MTSGKSYKSSGQDSTMLIPVNTECTGFNNIIVAGGVDYAIKM